MQMNAEYTSPPSLGLRLENYTEEIVINNKLKYNISLNRYSCCHHSAMDQTKVLKCSGTSKFK
jgi:hypothetical protein